MKIPTHSGQSVSISGPSAGNLAANSIDNAATEQVDLLVSQGGGILGKVLRGPGSGKGFSYFLLVPSLIAFGISCYLAFAALTASDVAGCGGGSFFDCSHVLHSKYSKWLGVPVSVFAAINYLAMLVALATISLTNVGAVVKRLSWATVCCAGMAAGLAAVWFVYLQAAVIGHFCPWCLGAHTCGLVIAVAIAIKRPVGNKLTLAMAVLAAASIGVMGMMQWMAEEPAKFTITVHDEETESQDNSDPNADDSMLFSAPMDEDGSVFEAPFEDETEEPEESGDSNDTVSASRKSVNLYATTLAAMLSNSSMLTYTPQEEGNKGDQEDAEEGDQEEAEPERRTVRIKGNLQLDPKQWPLLGAPNAKHIFVEMFDYACPHCRATHRAIKGACDEMGENVAVIVLPVPLNSACNNAITRTGANFVDSCKMARLAVACWRVDPEQFQVFHHWMFEGGSCPSYARAKEKVDALVGKDKIDEELGKEAVRKYVSKHVQLYKHVGKGMVPKLLFPTTTVEGEYSSTSALVKLIKERAN